MAPKRSKWRAPTQGAIHAVLTDVVMPGMSGPQLVEELQHEHPRLAALFMSGYTSDAVLRHGIATGEADFLQKPFSTSALAAKLRQVLDRKITESAEITGSHGATEAPRMIGQRQIGSNWTDR